MNGRLLRADPRWGGGVKRYSTWPVLQQQTNAEHTWQVIRILVTIWPDAPAPVIVAALYHDSGELGSGDIPYPYKARHPELKSIMDGLEEASLREQGLSVPDIPGLWRWRLKTADLIEMLEKGMDEVLLGNRHGVPIIRGIEENLNERLRGQMDEAAVSSYLMDRWQRYRAYEREK